jgi:flavin-dependent dehydrogenase
VRSLRERLFQFNRKHGIEGKIRFQKGFPIPAGKRKNDVYRERLLFLGDAGGLVDPLTGEGIYYAVESGVIAAEVVAKSFEEGNLEILKLYRKSVDRVMGSEFFWAKIVGNLFFRLKGLNFYVIERIPEVGSLTAALLAGEVSYRKGIGKYFKLLPESIVRF